jgi:hypothetical protein
MAPQSVISTTLQLLRDRLVDNSFLSHPLIRAIEEAGNLILSRFPAVFASNNP